MRLTTTGLGIGTTSPSAKLHIASDYALMTTTGSNLNWELTNGTVKSIYGVDAVETTAFFGSQTNHALVLRTNNTERMRITSGGIVSVGGTDGLTTSTYAGKLSVYTAGGANLSIGGGSNTTNTIMSRFITVNTNNGNSGNESSSSFYGITSIESALTTSNSNTSGNSGGYIMFKTKGDAGTLDERMRITSAGNVGIGNTGTNAKLEVTASTGEVFRADAASGAYRIVANQTGVHMNGDVGIGTTTPAYKLDVNRSSLGTIAQFIANDGTYNPRLLINGTADGLQLFATFSTVADALMFGTGNTEKMRITSGGTLLIGTTTEEFAGGKLQVAGAIRAAGQFTSVLSSSSFAYFDGSGQVVSSASSASALYLDTTWNTTGNPDGIYLNVTNTASGSSSKLLNLKVDNASQFSVSKGGAIQTSDPTNGTARPWKLGDARSGGISTDSYIIVSVNGVTYSIPALNGLP
jgi:hypothetical protein